MTDLEPLPIAPQVVPLHKTSNPKPEELPQISCHHCGSLKFIKKRKSKAGHQMHICKSCGRYFTYNPNKKKITVASDPETEYKKDIWDCRALGIPHRVGSFDYSLNFTSIGQEWLLPTVKQYIRFNLTILSHTSTSQKLLAIKRFSRYLARSYPQIGVQEIDRSVIISFLGYLSSLGLSASTKSKNISAIKGFFEFCIQNKLAEYQRYLIRSEDFPKRSKPLPRFIPDEVITQLNQHLDDLPDPVARMVLVIQECGMRISELLYLKHDCLIQDKSGDWFLKYYQFKMKKDITIPISKEITFVIQEQQRYINNNLQNFQYLFCSTEGGGKAVKLGFLPIPKNMTALTFSRNLNRLAIKHNIVTASGSLWHFQAHQFRHTVGTRMINNGVPQHIIQRYLGHESPNMTAVYAQIHDQTMKKEISKFQSKVVNIAGQVVESNEVNADAEGLAWFKRNVQAQALANGSCALPTISQGCPHANACLTCAHFRTTAEFLADHREQLERTEQILAKAKANGWSRQIEMNEAVAENLRKMIASLEEESNA
jgi:integrase/recombinase XerD